MSGLLVYSLCSWILAELCCTKMWLMWFKMKVTKHKHACICKAVCSTNSGQTHNYGGAVSLEYDVSRILKIPLKL